MARKGFLPVDDRAQFEILVRLPEGRSDYPFSFAEFFRKFLTGYAISGTQGEPSALAYSPDGKTLASAGREGLIRLWDVAAIPGLDRPGGGAALPAPGGEGKPR